MTPTTREAYQLLHRGSLAFATMEEHGIGVDVGYLKSSVKKLGAEIRELTEQLWADPVGRLWKEAFGDKAKLGSRPQLADVIFKRLGFQARAKTESGDKDSTEESAFRGIELPFLGNYFRLAKLTKLRKTYFLNVLSEQQGGRLHPSFNLHTVQTYRSSCSDPNFHNIPVRDPDLGKRIRKAFRASEGNYFVEVDLAGAEVRVSYCYHLDPVMRDYLCDPTTDMHRDTAAQLFCLDVEFLKQHKDWAKKTVRDWAKNRFVFPQFYGSVFFQCAPHIWDALTETVPGGGYKYKLPDGTPFPEHLKKFGVTKLGEKLSEWSTGRIVTEPGSFIDHVRKVEKSFWEERFTVYTGWKDRWLRNYQAKGYFDLHTGFRCSGLYRRNQVINYPVQGAAFHIELLAVILMTEYIEKHRMRSRIVGQIHDSTIADVPPDEIDDYLSALYHIITVTIPKRWPWVTIPLEVEAEVCPVGATWADKRLWTKGDNGCWSQKA